MHRLYDLIDAAEGKGSVLNRNPLRDKSWLAEKSPSCIAYCQ